MPAPPTKSASTTTETISTGSACSKGIPTAGRAVVRPCAEAPGSVTRFLGFRMDQ
ncbi:hypothetical protein GCM10010306_059820 [Streptomyces umbrinus]|nr:hypothetical protein GCM10010306_059820 [Streptomyces umbrinus]